MGHRAVALLMSVVLLRPCIQQVRSLGQVTGQQLKKIGKTGRINAKRPLYLAAFSNLVGVRGFEPPTPSSRTKCATKLRYTPMSAGREFTESPDPTQAFFAFGRKKSAVRSTIQHSFHPFTGLQPAGDIPATGRQARRRDAGPSRRRCQSATVPCSSQSAACWRQLRERAGFSSNSSRSVSLRT